jgi:acetylornithine/N-succinyldiaminopimelate aminotransferase
MKLFDVYPLFDINIVKGKGCHVWDDQGTEYLDLYGGHAVISIGHAHPYYVEMISNQVAQLGFYSNSVVNKLQQEVADRLGKLSGYDDYQLFLINSGAEANENALKLASFYNGRKRVLSFCKAFHGRTSLAVEVTHNPKIIAPINDNGHVTYLPLNDIEAAKAELAKGDVCAVIIEGIQGVGGIQVPEVKFLKELSKACEEVDAVLVLDEIQSGYGRSGKFFAHQHAGIRPDMITVLSFCKAFHGRTSLAVEVTHNPKIIAPINDNGHVTYLPLNDIEAAKAELAKGDVCAVIIEGIQGADGLHSYH